MNAELQIQDVASEYLSAIVAKHAVRPSAVRAAEGLFPLLKEWAAGSPFAIELSGSHAKGTATALGTDVDILVSLDQASGHSIRTFTGGCFTGWDIGGCVRRQEMFRCGWRAVA